MSEFKNSNGEIRLNLEQQKKQAKELLRQFKACQVSAFKRFEQYHPQGKKLDADMAVAIQFIYLGQDGYFRSMIQVNDTGRALLNRQVNGLQINPINRWVGGVPLCSHQPLWLWDEERGQPISRASLGVTQR